MLIEKYRNTDLHSNVLQLIQPTFDAFKAEHKQKLSAEEGTSSSDDFEWLQTIKDNLSLLDTLIQQQA
jgi:hypothetical protein